MGNYERHQGNRMWQWRHPRLPLVRQLRMFQVLSFVQGLITERHLSGQLLWIWEISPWIYTTLSHHKGERFLQWCYNQLLNFRSGATHRELLSFLRGRQVLTKTLALGLVHLYSCSNRSENSPECSWDITKRNPYPPAIHLWEIREVCLTKPFLSSGSDFRVYTLPERPHSPSWSHFYNLH